MHYESHESFQLSVEGQNEGGIHSTCHLIKSHHSDFLGVKNELSFFLI